MDRDKTILLVEDNPDDIELTRRALEQNRILNDLIVIDDGEAALQFLLDEKKRLPQVVLLDLKLTKLDGLEVLRRLRNHPRTNLLPVVILTSSRDEQDLVAGYNLGANSYICKPVDFIQFTEAVRQLGIYWLLLNIPAPYR